VAKCDASAYSNVMAVVDITYVAAAGGGLLSFLSPCVLPLVPAYLSFLAGTSFDELTANAKDEAKQNHSRRALLMAGGFVAGFTTVFVALGASATAVNHLLIENLDVLAKIAAVAIVIFGLHFTGLVTIPLLYREARVHVGMRPANWFGAYGIGAAFAFGWTPCVGPILATILALAASDSSVTYGISLLTVYSLGLGIPFLLAALAINPFLLFFRRFRRHLRKVEIATGALMIATGLLIFFDGLQVLSYWLLDLFPALATIG